MKKRLDKKLAVNEKVDKSYEQMCEVARLGLLKFGKLSIPYLMRKLKCSSLMAKRIFNKVSSDNDCNVAMPMPLVKVHGSKLTNGKFTDGLQLDNKAKPTQLVFRD
jgi:hypothetical protein